MTHIMRRVYMYSIQVDLVTCCKNFLSCGHIDKPPVAKVKLPHHHDDVRVRIFLCIRTINLDRGGVVLKISLATYIYF